MPQYPSPEERNTRRRYYTHVNTVDRANRRRYDLTDIIEAVRRRAIAHTESRMQGELRNLTAGERGNIFRLRSGSAARIFRSARGGQSIRSSRQMFGPDPWVRPLGRRIGGGAWSWFRHGHSSARVLVAPANADASLAAQASTYQIYQDIDDTLAEVRSGGRPILERHPQEGRLESFVAGPDADASARFGTVRYYRHPSQPGNWTVAIGELRQFWVDGDELSPVSSRRVTQYMSGTSSSE